MSGRLKGFVRKWDETWGFGFIEPDGLRATGGTG